MIELAASFDAQLSTLAPYLIYLIVGAIVFFETGVLFALMDWIADKREFNGTHT